MFKSTQMDIQFKNSEQYLPVGSVPALHLNVLLCSYWIKWDSLKRQKDSLSFLTFIKGNDFAHFIRVILDLYSCKQEEGQIRNLHQSQSVQTCVWSLLNETFGIKHTIHCSYYIICKFIVKWLRYYSFLTFITLLMRTHTLPTLHSLCDTSSV